MSNFNRAVLGEVLKNGIKQLRLELNEGMEVLARASMSGSG